MDGLAFAFAGKTQTAYSHGANRQTLGGRVKPFMGRGAAERDALGETERAELAPLHRELSGAGRAIR